MTVELSHPDRVYWPESGLTKRDLAEYYCDVAPVLLPHLRERPFTIRQHYTVPRGPFRWIKDKPPEAPEWIPVTPQPAKSRGGALVKYVLVNDAETLLWLVDFGVVDLHVWPSRADAPDSPDYVLFDLDPARVEFADVAHAALLKRDALTSIDLDSYPMTTGGDGMHVRVPLARTHTHKDVRRFADIVGSALRDASDGLVTLERRLDRRHGVFLDTKMNGHGQQIVAPYSVRPLPGAPVATPLRWDEVDERLDPSAFTPDAVLARVHAHGDLYGPLLDGRQRLDRALASASSR
jgi:bifunctional non-homologous end joining protein LigD